MDFIDDLTCNLLKCADVPELQSLKITLLKFTYPLQRPNIPSLSNYSLLLLRINYFFCDLNFLYGYLKKFARIFIRGSVISRYL